MKNPTKLLIRLTVMFTAIYFAVVYALAWCGVEFFNDAYIVMFEVCVCAIMSKQGKYHCKYMKYTAWDLTCADTITRLDSAYDLLSDEMTIVLSALLINLAWIIPFVLAIRHYYKVITIKSKYGVQQRGTEQD